jgi:diaminopimelate epimerase
MRITFAKYQGIGNDFVLVDDPAAVAAIDTDRAARLCDRHYGVGADGVLLVSHEGGRARMIVRNADGSRPQTCGNGLRCVALHLWRTKVVGSDPFDIEADAGPQPCRMLDEGARVQVSMRGASFAPSAVPIVADAPLIDAPFGIDGRELKLTALSVGNPHAVIFDDVGEERLALGPVLEQDPRFPEGANVGFARMLGPREIALDVWERGVGWTLACGSGACACAAAAVETSRVPRGTPLTVNLPGGPLEIVAGAVGEPIAMTGPARHVFDGTIEL